MGNLEDILRGHAKRHNIGRQVEAVGVVEAATSEIEKHIPRNDFSVISFKEGVLKIGIDSASAKNEISINIKKEFREKYGVKKIIFNSRQDEPLF